MRTLFRAGDRLYRTTDETFLVVECKRCRLLRLYPQPEPDQLRRYYPENYWFSPGERTAGGLAEAYRRFVLRDHVGFVAHAIRESSENGVVLDVGCGGGLFLRQLAQRAFPGQTLRMAGLDMSEPAASVAWKDNRVGVMCASLTSAPLPDESCAAITMFHVLEHLYEPASYLYAAHRLLRPDGRLIVQVPNAACWQFLLFGENWNGIDAPRHLVDFKARDMDAMLEECGFEPVRHKHFSLRDNPAGFASSLAPALDPMSRRVRQVAESAASTLCKDLLYFAMTVAATPFALLEAACRQGSTVMVEARKKS